MYQNFHYCCFSHGLPGNCTLATTRHNPPPQKDDVLTQPSSPHVDSIWAFSNVKLRDRVQQRLRKGQRRRATFDELAQREAKVHEWLPLACFSRKSVFCQGKLCLSVQHRLDALTQGLRRSLGQLLCFRSTTPFRTSGIGTAAEVLCKRDTSHRRAAAVGGAHALFSHLAKEIAHLWVLLCYKTGHFQLLGNVNEEPVTSSRTCNTKRAVHQRGEKRRRQRTCLQHVQRDTYCCSGRTASSTPADRLCSMHCVISAFLSRVLRGCL